MSDLGNKVEEAEAGQMTWSPRNVPLHNHDQHDHEAIDLMPFLNGTTKRETVKRPSRLVDLNWTLQAQMNNESKNLFDTLLVSPGMRLCW